MIQIVQDKQCSNCSSINECKYITIKNLTYMQCKKCMHKKLVATTTYLSNTNKQMNIIIEPVPNIEIF